MKYCPYCAESIPEDVKVCPNCKKSLDLNLLKEMYISFNKFRSRDFLQLGHTFTSSGIDSAQYGQYFMLTS